jgi:hypothetical protein
VIKVRIIAGTLLLVSAMVFPMGMLWWLNDRVKRRPKLRPRQIGMLLALNGILPVGLVVFGVGLLSARTWEMLAVKMVVALAALVTLALLCGLWLDARRGPAE